MASAPEKVLAAALALFDARGYSATTIEDVRLEAGVSVGSIYHHFGSKEGIAGALYVQSLELYQQGLVARLGRSASAERGVRGTVVNHLRWVAGSPERARFLMHRRETALAAATEHRVEALNRRTFEEIDRWYRPRAEAGALAPLEQPLLYAVWLGPAQEFARIAIEREPASVAKRLAAAEKPLADAAWAALGR